MSRIPTPAMIAGAWDVIHRENSGVAKLGPGLGVREIWQAMYDASAIEAQRATTPQSGVVADESAVAESQTPDNSRTTP